MDLDEAHLVQIDQKIIITLLLLFFNFPSWIRIRILNADPDPRGKMIADPDP